LSLKSLAKIVLLALPLLSYSWQLQAANDNTNQTDKRSDAVIFLSKQATITYVRPNLGYNGNYMGGIYDDFTVAGPVNMWDYEKGFLVQSMNPELYGLNFPTTGMDGLYFDLLIEGVDANELTWEPVTHEGITATVTRKVANDYWIPDDNYTGYRYPNGTEVVTRVTLTGPQAISQWDNDRPSAIGVPKLPQTFELVGKDSDGYEVVRYGFVLKQWFVIRSPAGTGRGYQRGKAYEEGEINKNPRRYTYPNAQAWCESLGYRLPHIKDLTNARCNEGTMAGMEDMCLGAISATPISDAFQYYQRRIGAGMTGEWGELDRYRIGLNMDIPVHFWTDDTSLKYDYTSFSVNMNNGVIGTLNDHRSLEECTANGGKGTYGCANATICVTP
ncbi:MULTISPECIES: hypothetical protein, partial [unclassified Gilliamella]